MHYAERAKPLVFAETLPELHDNDTFSLLGYVFVITQVIGETVWIKPAGISRDKRCSKLRLQQLLAITTKAGISC